MAWNLEHGGVAATPVAAIDWSVIAMTDAADRFAWATEWQLSQAAASVTEAVWWITLIDATLVRYEPHGYEKTLASLGPRRRRKTEETLTGLRYVRNKLGASVDPATLIRPFRRNAGGVGGDISGGDISGAGGVGDISGAGGPGGASAWTWNTLPEPDLALLPENSRDWETSRYRAYQARLAGHDVGRVFARCTAFLEQAAAQQVYQPRESMM
jgi:hypothetical protein